MTATMSTPTCPHCHTSTWVADSTTGGLRELSCLCGARWWPVTPLERVDMTDPERRSSHCPKGHEYTPENTMRNHGGRACRTCGRERVRRNRQAQKVGK